MPDSLTCSPQLCTVVVPRDRLPPLFGKQPVPIGAVQTAADPRGVAGADVGPMALPGAGADPRAAVGEGPAMP